MTQKSLFESVTKVALQDIIEGHATSSKFGYIISQESMEELTDALLSFVLMNRNLKEMGDRVISGGTPKDNIKPLASSRTR